MWRPAPGATFRRNRSSAHVPDPAIVFGLLPDTSRRAGTGRNSMSHGPDVDDTRSWPRRRYGRGGARRNTLPRPLQSSPSARSMCIDPRSASAVRAMSESVWTAEVRPPGLPDMSTPPTDIARRSFLRGRVRSAALQRREPDPERIERMGIDIETVRIEEEVEARVLPVDRPGHALLGEHVVQRRPKPHPVAVRALADILRADPFQACDTGRGAHRIRIVGPLVTDLLEPLRRRRLESSRSRMPPVPSPPRREAPLPGSWRMSRDPA